MSHFLNALDAEIAELERELAADPRYMKLREAKKLRAYYVGGAEIKQSPMNLQAVDAPAAKQTRMFATGASAEIIDAVKGYISGKTEPTPTRELVMFLERDGIEVKGAVPRNVVSSLLSKSPEFIAHGRSGWTLADTDADTNKAPDSEAGEQQSEAYSVEPDPEANGLKAWPGGGT